jgi:adenosylcobinamide-GDP ribazoletransferase
MALRHLVVAVQFLTRLPTPQLADHRRDDLARAAPWYPAAGLLVGACVALSCLAGSYADMWVAALFGLIAWVLVTGALHLDGLADLTDATAAAHGDRVRFMAVLKDPHIGAFGVVAVVLQLAAKLVLLHALMDRGALWWVVAICGAARLGPLVWSRMLRVLGAGLADQSAGAVRPWHLAAWSALILACLPAAPWLLGAFPLIAAWWFYLKRQVGGVTGDCHGAGIELVETGLLILAVVSLTP